MKQYFLFAGINLSLNITKKSQKNACFTDESLKKGALNIQMLGLGCCLPHPYQNFWLRACPWASFS